MSGIWDYCPKTLVVENTPPDQPRGVTMNGWHFSSKPNIPWQYGFDVTIQDLRWYLQSGGAYDNTTDPTRNARRFEEFVRDHGLWDEFDFPHPHFGTVKCKFATLPKVPKAIPNSGGIIDAFTVQLLHNNPAYSTQLGINVTGALSQVTLSNLSGTAAGSGGGAVPGNAGGALGATITLTAIVGGAAGGGAASASGAFGATVTLTAPTGGAVGNNNVNINAAMPPAIILTQPIIALAGTNPGTGIAVPFGISSNSNSPVGTPYSSAVQITPMGATVNGAVGQAGYDVILCIGDSYTVGIFNRDPIIDDDWPLVYQYRSNGADPAYQKIDKDISPLSQNISNINLNNRFLSPAEYFGRQYSKRTGRKVLLVPMGWNGTKWVGAGNAWSVGSGSHEGSVTQTNLAIAAAKAQYADSKFVGIVQFGGANDQSGAASYANYYSALSNSITDFRNRILTNGSSGAAVGTNAWYLIGGMLPDFTGNVMTNYWPTDQAMRDVGRDMTNVLYVPSPFGYLDVGITTLHPLNTGNRAIPVLWDAAFTDSTAAVITSPATFTSYAGSPLRFEITADKYVRWTLSGPDAANFELIDDYVNFSSNSVGNAMSTLVTVLRWTGGGNAVQGNYNVTVTCKTTTGVTTSKNLTISIPAAYGTASAGAVTATLTLARTTKANQFVSSTTLPARYTGIAFGAGLNLILLETGGQVSSVQVNGVSATRVSGVQTDARTVWSVPIATAGNYNLDCFGPASQTLVAFAVSVVTLTNTLAAPTATDNVAPATSTSMASASLTIGTGGIILGTGVGRTSDALNSGTFLASPNNSYFWSQRTTSGSVQLTGANGSRQVIALAYDKAP